MNNVKIRHVHHITDEQFDTCFDMVNVFKWDEEDKESFRDIIQHGVNVLKESMFVCEANGQICGFLKAKNQALPHFADMFPSNLKASLIEWLCIHPNMRSIGIGKNLLHTYTDYAVQQGVQVLFTKSLSNPRVRNFWAEQNFITIGRKHMMGKLLTNGR